MNETDQRILLIHPPSREIYSRTVIREGAPASPPLWPAVISPSLRSRGFTVRFLDLNLARHPKSQLVGMLKSFRPDAVGIHCTTPHVPAVKNLLALVGQLTPKPRILIGGPHPSALPGDTLSELSGDIAITGEGDDTPAEVLNSPDLSQEKGIAFRDTSGEFVQNPPRDPIENLDTLPFPAWELYDLTRYRTTKLLARRNPAGWIETSRGCPHTCPFCTKTVFGTRFRSKSPGRVLEEIRGMLASGFREIHIADDGFSTDPERAIEICDRITASGLEFPWSPVTGVRIDTLNDALLARMKESGCYRICIGIESGSQRVLDRIGKGISLDQVERVVSRCRELGMETFGFFMIGLPGEDEASMQATIDFARRLKLDLAKISFTIPLPATPLYRELEEQGLLQNRDWSDFNLYRTPRNLYLHPDVDWDTVEKYFYRFYRSFYFAPGFILRRLGRSLANGTLPGDVLSMLRTRWKK